MMKKNVAMSVVSVLLVTTACISEKASDKINPENVAKVTEENAAKGKLPKIKFNETEHDFGTITEGEKVETEFVITNEGESDLIIINAQGSCGCTVPDWPKEMIKPGASAPMKVTFDSSGKPGQQQKTVTLTTNTKEGTEKVSIKANVTPKAGGATPARN